MTKLYELLNKSFGAKFTIAVGDESKEITLGVFTIEQLFKFEEEGLTLSELMTNMQTKPATFGAKLAWELMVPEDRAFFEDSIVNFRKSLTIQNMTPLGEALNTVITGSLPDPKND